MTRALRYSLVTPPGDALSRPGISTFTVRVDIAARTVRLSGDVDLGAVPALVTSAATFRDATPGVVTADVAAVDFVDATGLGAFVALSNALRGRDQTLLVRHAVPQVRRIFVLGGLSSLLADD